MSMNDLTSDMLTRIRNAVRNDAKKVTVISNKLNIGVAGVLKSEGYINEFELVEDGRQGPAQAFHPFFSPWVRFYC